MSYKETLSMPITSFEMRGNLPQKEPKLIEEWNSLKLYEKMNENREGCEEFLLHDGPPYANGDIHCGHMLNRLLKDFVVRSKNMEGFKTPFVFGWDTHGLPIEVKVTKSGVDRKKMGVAEFRDLCHDYALKQVERQKGEIKRLGVMGDYDHPYMTLQPEFEAREIEVFAAMALKGLIYKGLKPVYWSPSSESALAEAEVEYKDVTAKTLYVYFDFVDGLGVVPNEAKIIVWTTTPWTIPADLAITLNPRFEYGLFHTEKGNFVFLCSLKDSLKETLGFSTCELIKSFKGSELEKASVKHPLYDRTSLIINANFVTEDSGTGCVHTAPDHGVDDFNACLPYGIKPFCPVDEKGVMHLGENDPCNGLFYEKANDVVIEELKNNGHLLKEVDIVHSYPHDWRTHKPVIFRATPQWFCSIEPIKPMLLEEIHKVKWEPSWGEGKMENMIRDRNDWCISRQRAWGVPLPIIYEEDGTPIINKEVFDHIASIIRKEGSGAWWRRSVTELLPDGFSSAKSPNKNFRKETDIMDVWFDSGSSWAGVLLERGMKYPADMYLEGNDQYRGWFNSSLILSTAVMGKAPFKSVLTHGWVMDENSVKMSKSLGNGIDPSKVANVYGADILRLYSASVNYEADVRLSDSIIASVADNYRKIRNTFRFILGNLQDGANKPYVYPEVAPKLYPLDEYMMAELEEIVEETRKDYDSYSFASLSGRLSSFMVELSSFYLDVTKDALYCDNVNSPRRKAIQYVLYNLAIKLCLLWNPILPFTMEEVYKAIPLKSHKASPQLEDMPAITHNYQKDPSFLKLLSLREVALKSLEDLRAKGTIGSSIEARLDLKVVDNDVLAVLLSLGEDGAEELFGVSQISCSLGTKDEVLSSKAEGEKCDRCRRIEKGCVKKDDGLICPRCLAAIGEDK